MPNSNTTADTAAGIAALLAQILMAGMQVWVGASMDEPLAPWLFFFALSLGFAWFFFAGRLSRSSAHLKTEGQLHAA